MGEKTLEPVMQVAEIMAILPHRYPFLMVDRVLEVHEGPTPPSRMGRKAVAIKNVTMNEPFFMGHFPGRPIMPGVLIVEAMAQTGCMAFYRSSDGQSGQKIEVAIASIREARFRRPVVPGDTLLMTAEIIKDRGQMLVLRCDAKVDGKVVAEAELLASILFKS